MSIRNILMTLAASLLLWSAPAFAQERHIVDPAAMQQAITTQATTDQQNRAVVGSVLQRSQVREVAERLGLDVTRAEGALSTLTSAELAELAGPARQIDAQLAGGATIVVTTTTVLIILLVIIIIVMLMNNSGGRRSRMRRGGSHWGGGGWSGWNSGVGPVGGGGFGGGFGGFGGGRSGGGGGGASW